MSETTNQTGNRQGPREAFCLYHHDAKNVGDRACGGAQYFWPEYDLVRQNFSEVREIGPPSVIGGGQIYGQVRDLSARTPSDSLEKSAVWGIGLPLRGKDDSKVMDLAKSFGLFSTRNYEWRDQVEFVPCPSCMMKHFDNAPGPIHDVVIFAHHFKTPDLGKGKGFPILTNTAASVQTVINFLASGETVVTSSYHGVYWAQLLGRRVICVPYGDKFRSFQNSPAYATGATWYESLKSATRAEVMLEEYREINKNFARQVETLLEE